MDFDFVESGSGPALLFLPGSYSNHAAWRGVQEALSGAYRMISTSLPGYGDTPEIRPADVSDPALMADFVAAVAERVAEPFHLVGHSYGGFNAFYSTLSNKIAPLSIVTFEANPVYCRSGDIPFPWAADMMDMKNRFADAVAANDPEAAGIIIDFWSFDGNFKSMPEQFRNFCRSLAATNLLDWQTAIGFDDDFSKFARLDMPCTVSRGELAIQAIRDISDLIVAHAKDATLHIEPGAGHFLISTHPKECAAVIDRHMAAVLA
jgi:pimeloyl-ACP methyl ester carboxylesterase